MSFDMLPLMIGSAAIAHCCFLILALVRLNKKLANRLLASVLLFLAIRIGSCIAGLIYEDFELIGTYLGALSVAMTGPLFYFYQLSLWDQSFRLHPKSYYHLIPAVLVLFAMPIQNMYIIFGLYLFTLLAMVIYVILGFRKSNSAGSSNRLDDIRWKWTIYFNSGITVILVLFLGQLVFFDPFVYEGIVIGSALVLYFLSLWAVKHVKLFMYDPRKKNGQQQIKELGKRIEEILSKEEIFTNPLMNVSRLAKHLRVPAYLVSLAVNDYFERSFPEMLNAIRIQRAELLLIDPKKSHYTIEAIAYESGFSTLSAFYSAFKRANRKTPVEYRKHSIVLSSKLVSYNNN